LAGTIPIPVLESIDPSNLAYNQPSQIPIEPKDAQNGLILVPEKYDIGCEFRWWRHDTTSQWSVCG
jgi:hypothetical protein